MPNQNQDANPGVATPKTGNRVPDRRRLLRNIAFGTITEDAYNYMMCIVRERTGTARLEQAIIRAEYRNSCDGELTTAKTNGASIASPGDTL